MTIPPDYFELRDVAESVAAAVETMEATAKTGDACGYVRACHDVIVSAEELRKVLRAGDERNGIEIVAGDQRWPGPRGRERNLGHIAQALDGGMKETT